MIEDDRPDMDDEKDEPKLKKPHKMVDEDPSDLRGQLAKGENSAQLEVEWFTDSVEQYSYVFLPSTDSESKVAYIWQILSIEELLRFLLSNLLATRRAGTCNLSKSIAKTI